MEQSNTTTKRDVYELITNRIIAQMEQGIIPWRMPWTTAGLPKNLLSNRPYGGINVWILASLGYHRNLFLSFRQLETLGGKVKKGQKACPVVFWNWKEEKEEGKEPKKKALLRYYMVFNIDQCEGIPEDKVPVLITRENNEPMGNCEQILEEYATCPPIHNNGSEAFYSPKQDYIQMPSMNAFVDTDHYYATLFHELVHSTGHQSRLDRKELTEPTNFGSKQYSQEELIAEMGASFLTSLSGIGDKPFKNHVAYIQNWLKVLQNDKRFVIIAAGKAQRAVDYILNVQIEKEDEK